MQDNACELLTSPRSLQGLLAPSLHQKGGQTKVLSLIGPDTMSGQWAGLFLLHQLSLPVNSTSFFAGEPFLRNPLVFDLSHSITSSINTFQAIVSPCPLCRLENRSRIESGQCTRRCTTMYHAY